MKNYIVHESSIGKIEFVTIKNNYIKRHSHILIVTVNKIKSVDITEDVIKKFYADLTNFYHDMYIKNTQFAQIYDLSFMEVSNVYNELNFLKKYTEFLKNFNIVFRECNNGTSIIVNSDAVKNLVNSLFLIYKSVKPMYVCKSYDESYEWLWSLINKT